MSNTIDTTTTSTEITFQCVSGEIYYREEINNLCKVHLIKIIQKIISDLNEKNRIFNIMEYMIL